jgi:hypothetical protein
MAGSRSFTAPQWQEPKSSAFVPIGVLPQLIAQFQVLASEVGLHKQTMSPFAADQKF